MLDAVSGKPAEAIAAANRAFVEAYGQADAAGAAATYTADAWAFPPGAPIVKGREAIQGFWQSVMEAGIAKIELETIELEFHGDVATEVGQGVLWLANGQVADRVKYVVVWQRANGQWKWHRDIWNSL